MKIAVIGANGRTGRIVVKDALARGHHVIAVARTHALSEPDHDNLTNERAEVLDPDALTRALDQANAVISTLGIGTQHAPTDVYSTGVSNTLDSMRSTGANKLAVISAAFQLDRGPNSRCSNAASYSRCSNAYSVPPTTTCGAWK